MMSKEDLIDTIKFANEAGQAQFKAGYDAGYLQGMRDGIAEARKIVNTVFDGDAMLTRGLT